MVVQSPLYTVISNRNLLYDPHIVRCRVCCITSLVILQYSHCMLVAESAMQCMPLDYIVIIVFNNNNKRAQVSCLKEEEETKCNFGCSKGGFNLHRLSPFRLSSVCTSSL